MTTATTLKPSKLRIRAYQVGFGDCFLLTFFYPQAKKQTDKERHVLMDFGSTGMTKGVSSSEQMMKVAEDIREQCNKKSRKLHIVVATHRHKDHISGFATADGEGTGDIIAALGPDVVIQPWTEEAEAQDPILKDKGKKGATAAKQLVEGQADSATAKSLNALHLASLHDMHQISESMKAEVKHLRDKSKFRQQLDKSVTEQIEFLANDNDLPNRSAVINLAKMGSKNHYVKHGYPLNLLRQLPGVKVHVLGPPDLEQHAKILKQRATDEDEFWMLQAAAQQFWGLQAATGGLIQDFAANESRLFPDAKVFRNSPSHDRWFIRQLRAMRGKQMLGLVRILDKAMNNTSLILLFEVGNKKLLFPGDAQIENWEYALKRDKKADLPLLKGVNLYKVGHHGSRNATPKTLWDNFEHKGEDGKAQRLKTVVSTMRGKHGHEESHTEVPRETLVEALSEESDYHTTEEAAERHELYIDLEITFGK
ncbi:MAG TPA: hypothetical protein VF658_21675 [Pyrinomonadaceae bacterium]|jgi:hypothetical protein